MLLLIAVNVAFLVITWVTLHEQNWLQFLFVAKATALKTANITILSAISKLSSNYHFGYWLSRQRVGPTIAQGVIRCRVGLYSY